MDFVNLTIGSRPLSYLWDFGDGVTSTMEHPSHIFPSIGTFTVTLTATNSLGSDSVSHPVIVQPCVPLEAITINGALTGTPGLYVFTTTYAPTEASLPISYLWDNGGTADYSMRTLDVGTYTLAVTATNCPGSMVLDTHQIVIHPAPPCTEVTGVDLSVVTSGTIYPGTIVEFSADVAPDDADKPYNYRVTVDGTPGDLSVSDVDPFIFTETFVLTGAHSVGIAVWNCEMAEWEAVTDTITVTVAEPPGCIGLTAITITGPITAAPGVYTFTTSYTPAEATLPIAYLWDNGDTADYSVRTLDVGTYTLAVTATNCLDAVVTDTHTVIIDWHIVYLPLVTKNH
jgi:PKD repeat protein